MSFGKSLFLGFLLFCTQAQGMQKTNLVIGISSDATWAAIGKGLCFFGIPTYFGFQYLKSDLYGAKAINTFAFENDIEYSSAKWGAYVATSAFIFKQHIFNAGVKSELYNKIAKILGVSIVVGKSYSMLYKSFLAKPEVPDKKDDKKDNKIDDVTQKINFKKLIKATPNSIKFAGIALTGILLGNIVK